MVNDDGSIYVANNNSLFGKIAWKNTKGYTGQIAITYIYKFANTGKGGSYPRIIYTDGSGESPGVPEVQDFNTATLISNANKVVDYVTFTYGTGGNSTTFYIQVALGSVASEYEPYNGTTIPISWQSEAGTVYGGTLDVTSGVLTVDRAMVDLGTVFYTKNTGLTGVDRYYHTFSNMKRFDDVQIVPNLFSSLFATSNIQSANAQYKTWVVAATGNIAYFYTPSGLYSDANAFQSAMSGVQLVYPLATPLPPIQLDPVTVTTLLGQNNI